MHKIPIQDWLDISSQYVYDVPLNGDQVVIIGVCTYSYMRNTWSLVQNINETNVKQNKTNGKKRKVTQYNTFYSVELKRIATEENAKVLSGEKTEAEKMTPNERMQLVSKLWKLEKSKHFANV